MSRPLVCLHTLLFVAALAGLALAGCGGGGGSSAAPPAGNTTLRGVVSLPSGQSASDLVVKVEGTPLQARVAADGSYEIAGVPPGTYTVSAVSPSANMGAHMTVAVPNGGMVSMRPMQLGAGGQMAGIVTVIAADGSLQARAGATIIARPAQTMGILQEGAPVPPANAASTPAADPDIRLTAASGGDGTYVIKGVSPGAYSLTARLDGFDPQERFVFVDVAHTAAADFTFGQPPAPKLGTVQGKVVVRDAAGVETPIAGASVGSDMVVAATGGGVGVAGSGTVVSASTTKSRGRQDTASIQVYPMPPIWAGFSAVTDASGAFTLKLPAGHHVLSCRQPDYQDTTAAVDVAAEQAVSLTIVMQPVPGERPHLSASLVVDKTSFALGETVPMRLVVKNDGSVPVSVSFDGREAFFTLLGANGETVWTYGVWYGVPMPMPMPAAGTESRARDRDVMVGVLDPGETREYKVAWDQRRFDGTLVTAGEYSLNAGVEIGTQRVEAAPVALKIGL